ncbi:MAG: alpha-D-ribose 1-methylphosphonate 5-triphosphate diphosphatase, partial [Acidiphilium sp.]|nr:alpha-D-ribose 1-methylphosphonate 5-triphosphate diphosphatase [Acidiphilium sp.]
MTVLTNAEIVLPDRVITGTLVIANGLITEITTATHPTGIDCAGDYLIPGIVDLHTDNLERQVLPRSNARWPSRSALLAHDAQCAIAGVTTVFDALCLGDSLDNQRHQTFVDGMRDLRDLAVTGALKAEHFLHLRCELPAADLPALLDSAIGDPRTR